MKKLHLSSVTAVLLFLTVLVAAAAESDLPQRQLKKYALNGNPHSADISPDEMLVAIQITRLDATNDPSKTKIVELAQLWKFQQSQMIAEVPLVERLADKEHPIQKFVAPRFTRFTSDGKLVVIYLDHFLYVLSGDDLHQVRKIAMEAPPDSNHSYEYKSVVHSVVEESRVQALEVSPAGHRVAAMWIGGQFAQMDIYDLDSGARLSDWAIPALGTNWPIAFDWRADGRQIVIAIPNTIRCLPPTDQPDLFVFDASSGAIRIQLNTGLLVGEVAVTPDDKAWVVDYDCQGVFRDHAPKIKVFDLRSGKRLHEQSGRGSGVRYTVSATRDGGRVAAYTGKMKVDFDWGDLQPWDAIVDRTFTVWDAATYRPIVTSQNLPQPQQQDQPGRETPVRISPRGGFVLFGSNIYELPEK